MNPLLNSLFASPVDASDLAETAEIRLTQEIRDLAASLGNDPVRIYEHVLNNYKYLPYDGSLKGSQQTYYDKSGNDMDLASLLMALLRASNVPCRYVQGTIEIPIDQAMNWTGMKTAQAAGDLFVSMGIPSIIVLSGPGGSPVSLQLEHVWVKAFVPTYKLGRPDGGPANTWLSLDPSFKQIDHIPQAPGVAENLPPDGLARLEAIFNSDGQTNLSFANSTYRAPSFFNSSTSALTAFPSTLILQEAVNDKVQTEAYLQTALPGSNVYEQWDHLLGSKRIRQEQFGILPPALPYLVRAILAEFNVVPAEMRHSVTFELVTTDGGSSTSTTIPTVDLACKRITLRYIPASEADFNIIYDSSTEPNFLAIPLGSIQMVPVIIVEGSGILAGEPMLMGTEHPLRVTFREPGGLTHASSSNVTVGAYLGIGIDLGGVSVDYLQHHADRLTAAKTAMLANLTTPTVGIDDTVGQFLYTAAIFYFAELNWRRQILGQATDTLIIRNPSLGVVKLDFGVTLNGITGLPVSVHHGIVNVDIDHDFTTVISATRDVNREWLVALYSGMISSDVEHRTIERVFGYPGVSAVKAVQRAIADGIPVHLIGSKNASSVINTLEIPAEDKAMISGYVNAGNLVFVPHTTLRFGDPDLPKPNDWIGIGYFVINPENGAGRYLISGMTSGGEALCNDFGCSKGVGVCLDVSQLTACLANEIKTLLPGCEPCGDVLSLSCANAALGCLGGALVCGSNLAKSCAGGEALEGVILIQEMAIASILNDMPASGHVAPCPGYAAEVEEMIHLVHTIKGVTDVLSLAANVIPIPDLNILSSPLIGGIFAVELMRQAMYSLVMESISPCVR